MVARANKRPPPPLQLDDDNTRYGRNLIQSRVVEKDSDSLFAQIYDTNWSKIIIVVASINLIRYLFSVVLIILSFHELETDKTPHAKQRAAIFTAVGVLYMVTGLVELFGIVSVVKRRLRLIRIYVHLAFASALVVTATGVLVAFAYFEFAEDVVNRCVSVASTGKVVVKLIYRSVGLVERAETITSENAHLQCFNAWSAESSAQILSVFVFYFLPSAFTCLLVYTYYRQCTDPYHPASLCSQMVAGSARHPYTRVAPAGTGYVSPYYSPVFMNGVNRGHQRTAGAGGAVMNSRSSAGSMNRRARRSGAGSTGSMSMSGRRSGRRGRVNWFAKMPLGSSSLSTATMSPGPPSFTGGGHLGYSYEMPYGQAASSAGSERGRKHA